MLFPKKVKHRKWQKARKNENKKSVATRGVNVSFGSHGLKATSSARLNSNHLEAARRVLKRNGGKTSKIWIRVFPDRPFTKKPNEVGMGKGKGNPEGFQVIVKPGRVLFEIDGVKDEVARTALIKAGKKLPLDVKVVARV